MSDSAPLTPEQVQDVLDTLHEALRGRGIRPEIKSMILTDVEEVLSVG